VIVLNKTTITHVEDFDKGDDFREVPSGYMIQEVINKPC
jgi:hypothetical protein